jgi:hypothetical protein
MMNKLAASLFVFAVGCASATDGAFHVSGRVTDKRVTHVVATNAADGSRVIAAVADETFDLALAPQQQWVVTFADASRSGAQMQISTLQVDGLDALVPQSDGALDLGHIKMGEQRALPGVAASDVVDALGLDKAMAQQLASTDNLALRVANPDMDNDGYIDAKATSLEIAGKYQVQLAGGDIGMWQLTQPDYRGATIKYTGTTLIAGVPGSMNMAMQTGTVTFESPFYGTAQGDSPAIMPGTAIGAPHIKFGQKDGLDLIGVVARPTFDAPRGAYNFGFANGNLTFTDVLPPTATVVESAQSYEVPFVRVSPSEAGCIADCAIDTVNLDWKNMTPAGWAQIDGKPAHVDIVLNRFGKHTYLAADMTGTSLEWQNLDITNTGLIRNELSYFTTQNICYIGVSYDSALGMKMTNELYNSGCF